MVWRVTEKMTASSYSELKVGGEVSIPAATTGTPMAGWKRAAAFRAPVPSSVATKYEY